MNSDKNAPFTDHDHAHCASQALQHATQATEQRGLRMTPVRQRVLEILLEEHRALGAYDVLERLAAEGYGKQPPVAYRALEFLVENGFAHRIRRLNAFTACTHPGKEHSPTFFICESCETVAEAPGDEIRTAMDAAARALDFGIERTSIEAAGICPACKKA